MLKMYAQVLVEMLTNQAGENGSILDTLDLDDIELKCILYECFNAERKTLKKEEEHYTEETRRYIEKYVAGQNKDNDYELRNQFKDLMAAQKASEEEDAHIMRRI